MTTLSGEINTAAATDNSYHVVTADGTVSSTAILDGFAVIRGYADGVAPTDLRGGGIAGQRRQPDALAPGLLGQLRGGPRGRRARRVGRADADGVRLRIQLFGHCRGRSLLRLRRGAPDSGCGLQGERDGSRARRRLRRQQGCREELPRRRQLPQRRVHRPGWSDLHQLHLHRKSGLRSGAAGRAQQHDRQLHSVRQRRRRRLPRILGGLLGVVQRRPREPGRRNRAHRRQPPLPERGRRRLPVGRRLTGGRRGKQRRGRRARDGSCGAAPLLRRSPDRRHRLGDGTDRRHGGLRACPAERVEPRGPVRLRRGRRLPLRHRFRTADALVPLAKRRPGPLRRRAALGNGDRHADDRPERHGQLRQLRRPCHRRAGTDADLRRRDGHRPSDPVHPGRHRSQVRRRRRDRSGGERSLPRRLHLRLDADRRLHHLGAGLQPDPVLRGFAGNAR